MSDVKQRDRHGGNLDGRGRLDPTGGAKVGGTSLTEQLGRQIQLRRASPGPAVGSQKLEAEPPTNTDVAPVQRREAGTPISYWEAVDVVDSGGALQRKSSTGSGTEDLGDVQQIAAHGVTGSGSSIPHADRIKESFGTEHAPLVDNIQAHVGGMAADAAGAIGAEAYATGAAVAFATQPDLHTAAHEAAHVSQQAGGVQLKGGIGQAGDQYEEHADAVADAVVRGESAAPLLSTGSSAASGQIQRKPAAEPAGALPGFMDGEKAPSTASMDTSMLITAIDIMITKVYRHLVDAVGAALDHLSDPEPPEEQSIVSQILMGALKAALGVIGESAFSALSDSVFDAVKKAGLGEGDYISDLVKSGIDTTVKAPLDKGKELIGEGAEKGVDAVAPSRDGDATAEEEGVGENTSKQGLLADYRMKLLNELADREANARTSFLVVARGLAKQPADKVAPLASAIAAPANLKELINRHREGALFGWMNVTSGVAKANAAHGNREYKNGLLVAPGTVDIYYGRYDTHDDPGMMSETFQGATNLSLYSILVNAEPVAVNELKASTIPVGKLPVARRVFIDGVPVLLVDSGGSPSILNVPMLAAIGHDERADAFRLAGNEHQPDPDGLAATDEDRSIHAAQRGRASASAGANEVAAHRGAARLVALMMGVTPKALGNKIQRTE